jgi:large subunit ribosomal protein L18
MASKNMNLYRRKRQGKTNYKKRIKFLMSKKPRLVVRKTNTQVILQVVEYASDGDKVVCGVNSGILKKAGWKYSCNNLPACYLAGLFLGKKAKAKQVKELILDAGLQTLVPGSRIYAALKGVIDAGVRVPVSEKVFPPHDRLTGKHIVQLFADSKDAARFSAYKKTKTDPKNLAQDFEAYKKKIISS